MTADKPDYMSLCAAFELRPNQITLSDVIDRQRQKYEKALELNSKLLA